MTAEQVVTLRHHGFEPAVLVRAGERYDLWLRSHQALSQDEEQALRQGLADRFGIAEPRGIFRDAIRLPGTSFEAAGERGPSRACRGTGGAVLRVAALARRAAQRTPRGSTRAATTFRHSTPRSASRSREIPLHFSRVNFHLGCLGGIEARCHFQSGGPLTTQAPLGPATPWTTARTSREGQSGGDGRSNWPGNQEDRGRLETGCW